jgi:hypothetical protein
MISRKYPSVTHVSARSIPRDDRLQILTAHQNENVFRERWQAPEEWSAPFWGGFIHALEGFARTEAPRRLKPVNIYFHWYSGDNWASLKALTRLFDWCLSQELHALTASEYARIVRDCRATRVFRKSDRHWVMVNQGAVRTFRLPRNEWRPDLAASRGVTGFRVCADGIFVHTDGSPRIELVLSQRPAPHLYLERSTAEIQFEILKPSEAAFTVQDVRPCVVTLGGFMPGASISLVVNDTPSIQTAGADGLLKLELPERAKVAARPSAVSERPGER